MHTHILRIGVTTAAVGLAVGVAAATADVSDTDHPGAQRITADGVGAVELGETHRSLHERGLVGKLHHGCELGGPSTRQAKLKGPLEGFVDYTQNNPRRAANITLTEGGAAHGVGFGDSIKDIKQEFPRAKVNHGTDRTFRLTFVSVPKKHSNKTRFTFGVSTKSHHVKVIGIPFVGICD